MDSWTKCADEATMLINKAFDMIEAVDKASKSGEKAEVVDLKCLETFLCSALSFTSAAKSAAIHKIPLRIMQKMRCAEELLAKIHCAQCRKVSLFSNSFKILTILFFLQAGDSCFWRKPGSPGEMLKVQGGEL